MDRIIKKKIMEEKRIKEIKETLNTESFMNATGNNLDMLFKYLFSATIGIRLGNIEAAKFILAVYKDSTYLTREEAVNNNYGRGIMNEKSPVLN